MSEVCKICGAEAKNRLGLSSHLRYKHNLKLIEYDGFLKIAGTMGISIQEAIAQIDRKEDESETEQAEDKVLDEWLGTDKVKIQPEIAKETESLQNPTPQTLQPPKQHAQSNTVRFRLGKPMQEIDLVLESGVERYNPFSGRPTIVEAGLHARFTNGRFDTADKKIIELIRAHPCHIKSPNRHLPHFPNIDIYEVQENR